MVENIIKVIPINSKHFTREKTKMEKFSNKRNDTNR